MRNYFFHFDYMLKYLKSKLIYPSKHSVRLQTLPLYIYILKMRIIEPFYLFTCTIIIIGFPILFYMYNIVSNIPYKFYSTPTDIFNIVIVGSKIDSILLAYQLIKLNTQYQDVINVTIIGEYDAELLSYADLKIENDKINMASLYSPYIQRKVINFCGTQPLMMEMFQDTSLQYKIKRSQTLFNKGNSRSIDQQFLNQIYNIQKQHNTVNSIFDYGLSHLTATSIFEKFQKHLKDGLSYDKINKKSMRNILNQIIPLSNEENENSKPLSNNGLVYMSESIGLDQKYIRDYISPIISSSYFHNVNAVAMFFKVLPLYCRNQGSKLNVKKGRTSNLAVILDQRVLIAKLLLRFQEHKYIHLINHKILNMEEHNNSLHLQLSDQSHNQTLKHSAKMVLFLQDFIEENQKQISYYKTLVDGIIANDDQFQQIYTIHFQSPPIVSITRLCTLDCKGYKNNAYLVLSKSKLAQKDLTMFAQHQIMHSKKIWLARSQLPPLALKFQQTEHFYRITDTQLISDNFEMKLIIYRSIAKLIYEKVEESL